MTSFPTVVEVTIFAIAGHLLTFFFKEPQMTRVFWDNEGVVAANKLPKIKVIAAADNVGVIFVDCCQIF